MMKSIFNSSVLIVEDNQDFLMLLKVMLTPMGFRHIYSAQDYETGLSLFADHTPDICLFDIELGKEKNGIDLAEAIRQHHHSVPIIYLTAHYTEEHYEMSRHTRPSSFMNKELSRLKLYQAVELALLQLEAQAVESNAPAVSVQPAPLITPNNYFFKIGDIYKSIPVENIAYFYSDQKFNYARTEGRSYPTTVQLKVLEEELKPNFIRIHKSYLVNIKHISSIDPGDSTLKIQEENLPIGYAYRKSFMENLRLIR